MRQNAFDLEILYTVVKEFCEVGRAKDGLVSKEVQDKRNETGKELRSILERQGIVKSAQQGSIVESVKVSRLHHVS